MNVPLMQQIARHDIHGRIEDMAEHAIYLCHREAMDALESIGAQVQFYKRSIGQIERWRMFHRIKGEKK